jgi:hypothetical protein
MNGKLRHSASRSGMTAEDVGIAEPNGSPRDVQLIESSRAHGTYFSVTSLKFVNFERYPFNSL